MHSTPAEASKRPRNVWGRDLISADEWTAIGRSLRLSAREIQMLEGVFDGETEAGIARDLDISAHTVHNYLVRLYRKLEVNSRCELLIRVFGEHLAINVGQR